MDYVELLFSKLLTVCARFCFVLNDVISQNKNSIYAIHKIAERWHKMELTQHLYRAENIKAIHDLHDAGVAHNVIAVFMTAEGIDIQPQDVTSIVNTYDALGKENYQARKWKHLLLPKN